MPSRTLSTLARLTLYLQLLALLCIAPLANAQLSIDNGCMEDVAGFGLNCTANDVGIADVVNLIILDDGCAFPGDTVDFQADYVVELTAQARHDIGLYFSTDGDPNGDRAITGQCRIVTMPFAPDPPWLDLDGTTDKFPGTNVVSNIQDQCGDIDDDHNPLVPNVLLLGVACVDSDGDGQLNLPNCTSWRQPGSNDLCLSPLDAFPGAPSKCKCGDLNVPILLPPAISIVKTFSSNADEDGSGSVTLNDTLTYSFLVTNTGFADLVNVTVTDPLPGLSPVSCPQDTLDVGTNMTCSATYVVMQADADAGQIANTAKATGEDALGEMVMDEDPELVPVEQNPELTLVKTADNPGDCTAAGALISYSYLVTNSGDVTIHQPITIDDDLTTDEACPGAPASLAPGDSITCSSSYTASQADVDAGSIQNTATASGSDPNGATVTSNPDDETVICPADPELTLVKTAENPDACTEAGVTLDYSYVVTNSGNVTISGPIVLDDDIASGEACDAGDLAPGDSVNCTASYLVTQADVDAGSVTNTASASGTDPSGSTVTSNLDDETVICPADPELTLVKTAENPDACTEAGVTLDYSYVVTNSGNVTISGPIVLDDDIASGETCDAGDLAPGASVNCTASYLVTQADIDAGSVMNTASASGTDPSGSTVTSNLDDETVICAPDPELTLVKTAENPDACTEAGVTLDYSYVVTNSGNVTISGPIVLDDDIATGESCDAGDLAPGDSVNCTASYLVTQADVDAGSVTNTASASGTDPGGATITSNLDDETVLCPADPSLALVKTADNPGACTLAGATLNYSYDVTNTGNVTISGPIVLVDDIASGESCPAGDLAPGASITCTASYVVTQADVDAGSVMNTASASGTDPSGSTVTSNLDDETVICAQNPALGLVKTPDNPDGCTLAGDLLNYSYEVTNIGNVTIIGPITLDDDIATGESCPAGNLAPGASITCTASYTTTQADVDAGSITNMAVATGSDSSGATITSNIDDATVLCPADPSLALVKTADNPDACTLVGATLNYSYEVTNTGNVTISGPIVLVDDIASGESCPAGDLAPGASTTCTASYVVTQADIDAGSVVNTASASGTDPSGATVTSNLDDATVICPQNPAIDVQKTPDTQEVEVGGTATFTIRVENIGNVTLDPVSVSDPQAPDCDRADLGALAPGDFTDYQCSATNVLAPFTNVATATGIDPGGVPVMDVDDAEVTVLVNLCELGKPKTLIVQYNGTGPAGDQHTQAGSEVIIDGDAMFLDPAYIEVIDHKGNVVFSGSVPLDGTIEVVGVHQKISPRTTFLIFDGQGGTLKETVQFHTSCSQPLNAGDEFGSIRVVNATH